VRFLAGPENTWTLQIQIADGRMTTSYERVAEGRGNDPDGPHEEGFSIWDLVDPKDPKVMGRFRTRGGTHRNFCLIRRRAVATFTGADASSSAGSHDADEAILGDETGEFLLTHFLGAGGRAGEILGQLGGRAAAGRGNGASPHAGAARGGSGHGRVVGGRRCSVRRPSPAASAKAR